MADIQQTHIFNIPTHIIADIFKLLPKKDLIQLTTVCKYFNNIISNSPEVLLKLPINLDNRGTLRDLKCHRKYSNVTVTTRNFKNRLSFIESIADNIVKFRIAGYGYGPSVNTQNFNINDLMDVLRKMPNLRKLIITLPRYFNEGFLESTLRLSLKLDILGGDFHPDLFPLFYNCSIKRCNVASFIDSNMHFVDFLKRQNKLEHLTFFSNELNLFEGESLLNVNFRLKAIKMFYTSAAIAANFAKFLLQFRQSLESLSLTVNDEQIWKILPLFENLKTLSISGPHSFESYADLVLPNVTKVIIENNIHPHLPTLLPNLTNITIHNPIEVRALCQFTKLESITVVGLVRAKIARSNAKKLTIAHYHTNDNEQRPFNYDNHNFEEIYVTEFSRETTPRWRKEFIDGGYAANLKIFSVTQGKYADCWDL